MTITYYSIHDKHQYQRRIEKINRTERVTNEGVLTQVGETTSI